MNLETVSQNLQRQGYDQAKVIKFIAWYRSCPEVWRSFEQTTLELIEQGKKAGAMDILGKVRWECEIIGGKDFKANNTMCPYLARVFAMKHPQHADFFEFREVGSEKEAA